jgi:hypothetical protein
MMTTVLFRRCLIHRLVIQRAPASRDAYNNKLKSYVDYKADVPCRFVPASRELALTASIQDQLLRLYTVLLPWDMEVLETDHVAHVTLASSGEALYEGPFTIRQLLYRTQQHAAHKTLVVQAIGV